MQSHFTRNATDQGNAAPQTSPALSASRRAQGRSALHGAAGPGVAEAILLRLDFTQLNRQDRRGRTALHEAAYKGRVRATML